MGNVQGKKDGSGDGKRSKTPAGTSTDEPQYNFEELANAAELARVTVKELNAEGWAGNCTEEFAKAALASDPFKAYHEDDKNEIEEVLFGEDSIITARSLLLNRYTTLEPLPIYGDDNYVTCLGLSDQFLVKLGEIKAELLDVGCGDSIFPAEASLYGFTVQGIDLHATNDESRRRKVFKQYAKNLVFAEYVKRQTKKEPKGSIGQPALRARCIKGLSSTENKYLSNPPSIGDCTNLPYKDNRFNGVVCSWLLMYLSEADAVTSLKEMVRVTKNGGWIRIFQGTEDPFGSSLGKGKGLPASFKVDGAQEVPTEGLRVFNVQK
jgi:SAM-dependent methyltransferase